MEVDRVVAITYVVQYVIMTSHYVRAVRSTPSHEVGSRCSFCSTNLSPISPTTLRLSVSRGDLQYPTRTVHYWLCVTSACQLNNLYFTRYPLNVLFTMHTAQSQHATATSDVMAFAVRSCSYHYRHPGIHPSDMLSPTFIHVVVTVQR